MRVSVSLSLDEDLLKIIDKQRGLATRSRFIEYKLNKALEDKMSDDNV